MAGKTFRHQHYFYIAAVIKTTKNKEEVANLFADAFGKENTSFKRELFLKQCGVTPVKCKCAPAKKPAKKKTVKKTTRKTAKKTKK